MAVATWELHHRQRRAAAVCAPDIALRLPRPALPSARPQGGTAVRVPAHVRRRIAALVLGAVVVAAVAMALPATGLTTAQAGMPARPVAVAPAPAATPWEATAVIGPGETVWELAAPHAPAGADLQLYVAEVLRHNGLDATAIPVGTVVRFPR